MRNPSLVTPPPLCKLCGVCCSLTITADEAKDFIRVLLSDKQKRPTKVLQTQSHARPPSVSLAFFSHDHSGTATQRTYLDAKHGCVVWKRKSEFLLIRLFFFSAFHSPPFSFSTLDFSCLHSQIPPFVPKLPGMFYFLFSSLSFACFCVSLRSLSLTQQTFKKSKPKPSNHRRSNRPFIFSRTRERGRGEC